jgi:hypothetical protein
MAEAISLQPSIDNGVKKGSPDFARGLAALPL